jgi:hypothetical protein
VRSLSEEIHRGRLHFQRNGAGVDAVSSSAVRAAVRDGDGGGARAMLPESLHAYMAAEGLYCSP